MMSYVGIGCMLGFLFDGFDLCCVEFIGDWDIDVWGYCIFKVVIFLYDLNWIFWLVGVRDLSGEVLIWFYVEYGYLFGKLIKKFVDEN